MMVEEGIEVQVVAEEIDRGVKEEGNRGRERQKKK